MTVKVRKMAKEECVEVTIKVKVPKRLMQLIEEQNYFGWSKEDFGCLQRKVLPVAN